MTLVNHASPTPVEPDRATISVSGVNATDRVLQAPEINPLRSILKPQIYAGARGTSTARFSATQNSNLCPVRGHRPGAAHSELSSLTRDGKEMRK